MPTDHTSRRTIIKVLATGIAAPVAANAATSPAGSLPDEGDVRVTDHGAKGDGITDDTDAFERAIRIASEQGRRLRIPAGRYRIARTLTIHRGIQIEGDGVEYSILIASMGKGQPAIHVLAKTTDSIIGLSLSGIRLNGMAKADPCDGIRLSTGGNGAAIHQATLRNIFISNVGIGIALAGVVYRSRMENITISGHVAQYGFYCDAEFEDVTYNSFRDLEVTNVASGAYAYWIHSNFSNFTNLTADGCCYFSSPGGSIRNLAIEHITAKKPPSNIAIQLNQVQIVDGINLIGVDKSKCGDGIRVIGKGLSLRGVRFVTPQPIRPVILTPGSEGTLSGVYIEQPVSKIGNYTPIEILKLWNIDAANSII